MLFTGYNELRLPQVNTLAFTLSNIVVNSYNQYNFQISLLAQQGWYVRGEEDFLNIFVLNSGNVLDSNNRVITTYNTGIPFSVSGWFNNGDVFSDFEGIQSLDQGNHGNTQPFGTLIFDCPSGTSLSTDVSIYGQEVSFDFNIPDFQAQTNVTGRIGANGYGLLFGSQTLFLQSFENLLDSSGQIVAFYTPSGLDVVFHDNDTSYQDNTVDGVLTLNTIFGPDQFEFSTDRSIATGSPWTVTGYSAGASFGSTFDGIWSGRSFIYQDSPSSLTLNYTIGKSNSLGASIDTSVYWSVASLNTTTGSYVSGFTLTASGQYLQPPTAKFTGYFYVTGLQQDLNSLLFSSGCTGPIPVSFSGLGNFGNGATGNLLTTAVLFQDIYTSGINTYYVVTGYQGISGGTGYTEAPFALIRTGKFGSTCYDVPKFYGFNQAWFRPSNTSGALAPTASFLTGLVLYTTGIISSGLTGYIVTGLDITNIGSGYDSTTYIPRMSFIRATGESMTGNASGTLSVKSTGINVLNYLTVEARSGNYPWQMQSTLSGTNPLTINDNSFSLRLTVSGAPTTLPWTGLISLKETVGSSYTYQESIFFAHNFDTDSGALKKNINVTGLAFAPSSELSFLLTQDDLDTLYAGVEFTNNNLGFDLGDLDF